MQHSPWQLASKASIGDVLGLSPLVTAFCRSYILTQYLTKLRKVQNKPFLSLQYKQTFWAEKTFQRPSVLLGAFSRVPGARIHVEEKGQRQKFRVANSQHMGSF